MNLQAFTNPAKAMVAVGQGLLAMDERPGTCNQRFARIGVAQTAGMRRAYRTLLLTTPGLGTCISGVILCDETIRQANDDGAHTLTRCQAAATQNSAQQVAKATLQLRRLAGRVQR